MKTRTRKNHTFTTIRVKVPHACNQKIREAEQLSAGYGLPVDFGKGDSDGILYGYFNDNVVVKCFEANDYNRMGMVSSFLGTIAERFCASKNGFLS